VAVLTFRLQRKLPYKRMLIVTGVLLAFVLVVMVGSTVRTMQGTGWVPIHAIDVQIPYWAGTWLGVFPTWETLGAQIGALVFVIGSYFAAEYVRIKRPRKRVAKATLSRPVQGEHPMNGGAAEAKLAPCSEDARPQRPSSSPSPSASQPSTASTTPSSADSRASTSGSMRSPV
jgi:high-affinity iron transporter